MVAGARTPLTVDLSGLRVAITAGAGGIGRVMADSFAACGAAVFVSDLDPASLSACPHPHMRADAGSVAECEAFIDAAVAHHGGLDVLVNNAGIGTAVPASREEPEEFRRVVEVNLYGSYWMAQAAAAVMGRGSAIVNIGSVLGSTTAELPQAAYSASKAAIIGLTRDLAQQWTGRKGIRVNAVAPGFFATEMTDQYVPGYLDKMVESRVPMGRAGELEECAAAVVFLASEAASYVSGIVLPVDGGLLVT